MAPKEQNVEPVFINANGPFRRIMAEVKEKMAEKRDRAILYGSTAFLALVLPFALSSTLQQETIIKDVKPETSRGGVPMFVFQNVISKTKQTDKTYVAPNIDQYLQTDTQAKNSIQKVPPKQVETEMAFQEAGWLIPGKVGTVAEYLLLSAVVLAAAKGLIKRTPAYTRAEAAFHQDLASQFSNMMDQAYVSNPYLQGQLDNQLTELINHNPKYAGRTLESMHDEVWALTAKKLNSYTLRDWTELEKLAKGISADVDELSRAADHFGVNKSNIKIDATLDYEKLCTAIVEDIEAKGRKFVEKWRTLSGTKSLTSLFRKSYADALKEMNIPQAGINDIMNTEAMTFARNQVESFRDLAFSGPIAKKFGTAGNWIAGKSLTMWKVLSSPFGPAVSMEDLALELVVNDEAFRLRLADNARIQNWFNDPARAWHSPGTPLNPEDISLMIKEFPEVRDALRDDPAIWNAVTGVAHEGNFWRIWGRAIKRAGVVAGVTAAAIGTYLLLDYAFSKTEHVPTYQEIQQQKADSLKALQQQGQTKALALQSANVTAYIPTFDLNHYKEFGSVAGSHHMYISPIKSTSGSYSPSLANEQTWSGDFIAPKKGSGISIGLSVQTINPTTLAESGSAEKKLPSLLIFGNAGNKIGYSMFEDIFSSDFKEGAVYRFSIRIGPDSWGFTTYEDGRKLDSKDNLPLPADWKSLKLDQFGVYLTTQTPADKGL